MKNQRIYKILYLQLMKGKITREKINRELTEYINLQKGVENEKGKMVQETLSRNS